MSDVVSPAESDAEPLDDDVAEPLALSEVVCEAESVVETLAAAPLSGASTMLLSVASVAWFAAVRSKEIGVASVMTERHPREFPAQQAAS